MAVRGKRNLRNLSDAGSAKKQVPDNLPIIGLMLLTILAFSDLKYFVFISKILESQCC